MYFTVSDTLGKGQVCLRAKEPIISEALSGCL